MSLERLSYMLCSSSCFAPSFRRRIWFLCSLAYLTIFDEFNSLFTVIVDFKCSLFRIKEGSEKKNLSPLFLGVNVTELPYDSINVLLASTSLFALLNYCVLVGSRKLFRNFAQPRHYKKRAKSCHIYSFFFTTVLVFLR